MDQLKVVLDIIKKYYFWVFCGLSVAIVLVAWGWAKKDLADQFEARERTLNRLFEDLGYVCGEVRHPNEPVVKAAKARIDDLKAEVGEAWDALKNEQDDNNKLAGQEDDADPAAANGGKATGKLTKTFRDAFDEFKKGDKDWKSGDELRSSLLEQYRNVIPNRINNKFEELQLLKVVKKESPADGGQAGNGAPKKKGDEIETIGLVKWDGHDAVRKRFQWLQQAPTTAQVVLAQEDLWVYEALFRIIINTNKDTPRELTHETAPVKEILALQIGKDGLGIRATKERTPGSAPSTPPAQSVTEETDVQLSPQEIFQQEVVPFTQKFCLDCHSGEGAEGQIALDAYRDAASVRTDRDRTTWQKVARALRGKDPDMPPEGSPKPTRDERQAVIRWVDIPVVWEKEADRYVNDDMQPLAPSMRHPYAQYKIMPIRMKLLIEEKKIPRLLTECANSTMPIEVRSVRIRPGEGRTIQLALPGEGRAAGATTGSDSRAQRPTTGTGGPPSGVIQRGERHVPVEIEGVICIYNPPNRELLGTGTPAVQPPETPTPGTTTTETPEPETPTTPVTTPATTPATTPGAPPAAPPAGPATTPGTPTGPG